ncbi:MAG TPA: hypothetical protein PLP01_00075 [Phycisphaerae bacterium]|nr:hypothetical protein [Phycisphaerae bacterium]HOI53626.1 hypothetical protein [Phycisphaerae bacterium]
MVSDCTQKDKLPLSTIASLSREELVDRLLHFHGKFAFDFNRQYLEQQPTAQLRHILVAAFKHASRQPPC